MLSMRNINFKKMSAQQSGVALIISLIFLVVGTLLGLSTLSGNVTEERMVRNTVQRQVAFEAAEIALLAGEAFVDDDANNVDELVFFTSGGVDDDDVNADNAGDECLNGFCTVARRTVGFDPDDPTPDRWLDNTLNVWADPNKHTALNLSAQDLLDLDLPEQPKYIIEFLRYIPGEDPDGKIGDTFCDTDGSGVQNDAEKQWIDWPYCVDDLKEYRITAVGYAGVNSEIRVMLQSIYIAD